MDQIMWNPFKKKTKKTEPKFKFEEGVDFHVVPDIKAAKAKDPHPWNIHFKGRIVKVHHLKIPDSPSEDGNLHVDIKAQVLYGGDFNQLENQEFGELLMELVERNLLARD